MSRVTDFIKDTARDTIDLLRDRTSEVRQGLQLFETWRINNPQFPTSGYRSLVDNGYRRNELVYACIREVATSVSEAPFMVGVQKAGVRIPVIDHPGLELVNHPNRIIETSQEFWEITLTIEHIDGNCYVWKERNDVGRPIGLWTLRPDWVRFVPKRNVAQSFYLYSPDGSFTSRSDVPIPLDDMIPFKHGVDPTAIYQQGMSPLRVAFRNTILDNDATDFFKVFFDNAGVPSGIITVKRKLQDQREANRIMKRWQQRYSGLTGWHAPAVMDEDASYQKIGLDFREMDMASLRDVPETRICMALGVPPILVGSAVGLKRSTYTNYGAAKTSFWDETLSPLFERHASKIDQDLIFPDFPSDVRATSFFDLSNVRALREDVSALWKRTTAALNMGGITINMFLVEIGKEPVDGGDVFLIPGNKTEKAAPPTVRSLVERLGEVRYHKLFNVVETHLLEEATEEVVVVGE